MAWVQYIKGHTETPFEEWVAQNLPSFKRPGVSWISVQADPWRLSSPAPDLAGLERAWERLRGSGSCVTKETVMTLAREHNLLTGKWMFFAEPGEEADHLWSLVARGVIAGSLGSVCSSAKVNPYNPSTSPNHVVCIYTADCTDREEIARSERAIRDAGLACKLLYKPDVYTHVGIYRDNHWGISPVLYQSQYDSQRGCHVVTDV